LSLNLQGIDVSDIEWVIQYRATNKFSTWWQRAGQSGHSLAVKATAILLVEPCFFDEEKEKAAQKAEKRATKNAAEGQLQPANTKRARTSKGTRQGPGSTVEIIGEKSRISKEMDDFINAEWHPENCRRKVANTNLGNDDLSM
jgi:superfamily II DNA/RNA helicase